MSQPEPELDADIRAFLDVCGPALLRLAHSEVPAANVATVLASLAGSYVHHVVLPGHELAFVALMARHTCELLRDFGHQVSPEAIVPIAEPRPAGEPVH